MHYLYSRMFIVININVGKCYNFTIDVLNSNTSMNFIFIWYP